MTATEGIPVEVDVSELMLWLRAQIDTDEQDAQRRKDYGGCCTGCACGCDPDSTLARVAAHRELLDYLAGWIEAGEIQPNTTWNDDAAGAVVAERSLAYLAAMYAGREGYRAEWKPDE